MSLNIELIRSSFEKAKPIAEEVVNKFYELLFHDYPSSKAFFENVEMNQQKKALLNSLVYIVDHLEDSAVLENYLKKMGERHLKYGVKEEHYPLVGNTLLKTFAFFFGKDWTSSLQNEWTKAYTIIASLMVEGAKSSALYDQEALQNIKESCHLILEKILQEELQGDFEKAARIKVRKLIFSLIQSEADNLVKKQKRAA